MSNVRFLTFMSACVLLISLLVITHAPLTNKILFRQVFSMRAQLLAANSSIDILTAEVTELRSQLQKLKGVDTPVVTTVTAGSRSLKKTMEVKPHICESAEALSKKIDADLDRWLTINNDAIRVADRYCHDYRVAISAFTECYENDEDEPESFKDCVREIYKASPPSEQML